MSNNDWETVPLDLDFSNSEITNTVSFEAALVGMEYHPASKKFIKRNKKAIKKRNECEEIILKKEPSNPYDSNAIKVLEASSLDKIGYLDRSSAEKLTFLKVKSFFGIVQSIDKDNNTIIRVVVETFLSIEDAQDIITDNAKRLIDRHYSNVLSDASFGSDPPTFKQFSFALDLGVDPRRKTFTSISKAIDRAKGKKGSKKQFPVLPEHRKFLYEVMCNNSPADRELLKDIREWHGEPLRKVTREEACDIVDFLELLDFDCPYCNRKTSNGDSCDKCGLSLRGIRIQLQIEKIQDNYIPTSERIHVHAILPSAIYKKPYYKYKISGRKKDSAGCMLVLIMLLACLIILCVPFL